METDKYGLKEYIRSVVGFPKEGIVFRDITTILQNSEGLVKSIDALTDKIDGVDFDYIVSPESRGFIFGMPIAYNLKKGFVPVRKPGKLPAETVSQSYSLEYGTATIEIHKDALKPGDKVVIIDDLMATGGTTEAIVKLVEELGAEVAKIVCLIDLKWLNGRELVKEYDYDCVVVYESE